MKPIKFKLVSSYGLTRAYPLDRESILICRLSKTKTLLPGDIGTAAALGFEPVNQYGVKIDPMELY